MLESPIALFDLDGTLADYDGEMIRRMTAMRAPEEGPLEWKHSDVESKHMAERRKAISKDPGFWTGLAIYEPGMELWELSKMLGFQHMILSKGPRSSPVAWTAKVEWVDKHLKAEGITITTEKGHYFGRVLVDDYPPYIMDWLAHRPRGLVVMPAHPWNENFEHPQVIRYIRHNFDAVREALIKARDRKDGEDWKAQ